MNCSEVASNIQLFFDEELSYAEAENFRKHLSLCPFCEAKVGAEQAFFKTTLREKLVRSALADGTAEAVRQYVMSATY